MKRLLVFSVLIFCFCVLMHHNLMISCNKRNPSLAGNSELGFAEFPLTDVRYNLAYNFGERGIHFARGALVNIVGNILRFGPQTTAQKAMEAVDRDSSGTQVYLKDNCKITRVGNVDILECPENQGELIFAKNGLFAELIDTPFEAPAITPVEDLVGYLLKQAGALPHDPADEDFINDYRSFTGSLGADNKSQDEITVLPPEFGTPPADGDRDGMPDDWEVDNGLDPNDPSDANGDLHGDGYTNIEEYINSIGEGIVTSVNDMTSGVPVTFQLNQNYPNPFNPETIITFSLSTGGSVLLKIYDLNGRKVMTLVNHKLLQPGEHRVVWRGKDDTGKNVASGVYFYQLSVNDSRAVRKLVLLR